MSFFVCKQKGVCIMGNYTTSTKETNELSFKDGKVFNAILDIMENLNVKKNGVELDDETGEVKYRYIKIGDLREALKPLLIKNKCMIRKIEAIKCFRDRKQSKSGVWINIDVVENSYIIQSLEDCSYVMGTGRGEGSGWGDSAVTLAEADAFKNFIGSSFCLVTDEESVNVETDDKAKNTETENEPVKKHKRRTKAEIEAEKESENKANENEETFSENKTESVEEPKISNPPVKLVAPEPKNEIVKNIDKNIDCEADDGVPVELPKKAFEEAKKLDKPISVEAKEPVEQKEEPSEDIYEKVEVAEEPTEPVEEQEPEEAIEPTEEQMSSDDEIKAYANVICPIKNRYVNGKTFEDVCGMALNNASEADKAARNCIIYVSSHPDRFKEKAPEFVKACMLAATKFNLNLTA